MGAFSYHVLTYTFLNMTNHLLANAFDAQSFGENGKALIDLLAQVFAEADQRPVLPYKSPEEQHAYWKNDFTQRGTLLDFFRDVIDKSILYHHPHYMGHQTAVPALPAVLASVVIDFLSNGMGVYEVGMVGNTLEKVLCEYLSQKFGLGDSSGGFVTSGGTLATLTVLLTARAHYLSHRAADKSDSASLCVITSDQSHYCVERAAITMGISRERIFKVPVDACYKMDTDALQTTYQQAVEAGLKVLCVVASAPSTSTGTYDDLVTIGTFCRSKNIWYHVDGAHGAAVVFSQKYKHLIDGIELADSIVMDFHKLMLTPGISTAVLLRNRALAYETFRQEADYLWEKQDHEWQHGGKSTYECTKSMTVLKVYSLFKQFGDAIFEDFVDYQYDLTRQFAQLIHEHPDFEIAHEPESNILCFRYKNAERLNELNAQLRKQLIESGEFYIVQTTIRGEIFLRTTLLNPRTTIAHIQSLIARLEQLAMELKLTL